MRSRSNGSLFLQANDIDRSRAKELFELMQGDRVVQDFFGNIDTYNR
ncbi:MAG: hypothetical protein ACI835_002987 [Planctomycetota bacterium]